MTNRERYKQAFSAINSSDKSFMEESKMTIISKKRTINQMVASIAACVLLVGGSTVVYATDLGGVQRTLQLWIHGDQTEVTIDFGADGSYAMEYTDSEGEKVHQGGGGVAINEDGSERPLTEAELMEHLDNPDVVYEDDGSVWVYYLNQRIDITDKFDDDVCYLQVTRGEETSYMTISFQNGWSSSPNKYPSPSLPN